MKFNIIIMILLLTQQINSANNFTVTFENEPIASVNRVEFTIPYLNNSVINVNKYIDFMEQLSSQVYKKPLNASIDRFGNIVPEHVGYKLDRNKLTETFYSYFFGHGPTDIEAPRLVLHPKVDSELLADIYEKNIGQYITYYNTRNKERTHNISLATEAINNYVIFPGKTFSFNQVVGKRTKAKGYLPAPVIVKGELSEGIGGGICQVSSTLYNAVDKVGVQILERYSHSRRVPYVPSGRDATVSWYGPDFKFVNNHNQPLLLRATSIEGKVIIKVYSSDMIRYEKRSIPSAPEQLPIEVKYSPELNTTN